MYQQQTYTFDAVVPAVLDAGLANSRVTFQAPDGVIVGAGQPSGDYVDVDGYVDIVCMDAPESIIRITANESKSISEIESDNSEHIWLAGNYPEIATHTEWRCVLTAANGTVTTYDVLGAESDSQGKTTRVRVQVATV